MNFFIQIAILLVSSYVAWALAPKPPAPKPAMLDDFDVPRAEQGTPIGVVFGTVIIKAPTLAWWGDLSTEPIKTKQSKK
jgi:hypothetical protein